MADGRGVMHTSRTPTPDASQGCGIISETGGDYFSELGGEIISESGGPDCLGMCILGAQQPDLGVGSELARFV